MGPRSMHLSRKPTECDASTTNGMSMAHDNTLRLYRSSDPYRRAAEPSRPSEETSAREPLAELARLLGQSDPFADFGRSHSRQGQQEAHDAPATAPDDWQGCPGVWASVCRRRCAARLGPGVEPCVEPRREPGLHAFVGSPRAAP